MTGPARPRVLVVSHEASRTGAPRIAVEILRGLASLPVERVVVIRWGGPLEPELRTAADRVRREPGRRLRVLLRRFGATRQLAVSVEEWAARRMLAAERPALAYLNTVKSACYVRPALDLGIPVVLHSHELGALLADTLARYRLDGRYQEVRLVACSSAAGTELQRVTGATDITVIHSAVDVGRIRELAGAGVPPAGTEPVVGACGTVDHRKGTDLWLRVAALVSDRMGAAAPMFAWIGGGDRDHYRRQVDAAGLAGVVQFVGGLDQPYPSMAALTILTVTSREDAFPLAVLEAMGLGVPVVAFDVGGLTEQLGPAGVVVPPGDVEGMADAVVRLLTDDAERARLSTAGIRRAEDQFGIERLHRSVCAVVVQELER